MRLLTPLFLAFLALVLASALPLAAAKSRRLAGWIHFVPVLGAAALLVRTGWGALSGEGMVRAVHVRIGPAAVPFLLDGLSGLFLIVIAVMAVMSALYSIRYLDHHPDQGVGGYYFRLPLFVLGMAALVAVDDLSVGFTLAWQIMTIASYQLIRHDRADASARRAAAKYLWLMQAAWAMIVGAGVLMGGGAGDSLHALAAKAGGLPPAVAAAAGLLLLAGFGMKAGVFPLGQLWLPDAHAAAPSPVSALLSGVMLKTGIFGLLRVFLVLGPEGRGDFDGRFWGLLLAAIGAATLFIGTLQSVKQSDAKRLLAFSSIGQIGYIVLGLGAAVMLRDSGAPALRALAGVVLLGALFHLLNHAVFKGLLFLTSGSLLYAAGTKDLNRLGGLIAFMPVTAALAAVGSISISGMPPTSGFASKWTIISGSLLAGDASAALVLFGIVALFTSAVTLACYVKFFGLAFTGSGIEWTASHPVREVPVSMLAAKGILAAICIAQGLVPALFVRPVLSALANSPGMDLVPGDAFSVSLMGLKLGDLFGSPLAAANSPLVVLGLLTAALLLAAGLRRSAGSTSRTVPTWLCGYQELNERNRFTDRGMFAALKDLFRWTGGRTGPR